MPKYGPVLLGACSRVPLRVTSGMDELVADESVLSGDVVEKGGTTVFCDGTEWDLDGGLSGYLLMVGLIYTTLSVPTGL